MSRYQITGIIEIHVGMREGDREREKQRQRETETETDRQTDRLTDRNTKSLQNKRIVTQLRRPHLVPIFGGHKNYAPPLSLDYYHSSYASPLSLDYYHSS